MQVFPKAIVLTTKPGVDAITSLYISTRPGGEENNSLRENPHKCYCVRIVNEFITNILGRRLVRNYQGVWQLSEPEQSEAVAKPARNLVILCKFFCVHRPYKELVSKEMNNDD